MEKTDLFKSDKNYYRAKKQAQKVEIPATQYLYTTGQCDPENEPFQKAIEQIYAAAYAIKFKYKKKDLDFVVPKMECFWWVEEGKVFVETPRDEWHWKIRIRMPDYVALEEEQVSSPIYTEHIPPTEAIQILHIGPYENEFENVQKILNYAEQNAMRIIGKHLEIYVTDPRKTEKSNLKTILRYQTA